MSGIERIRIKSSSTWLELRKRDVTASQVGALFGQHPYLTIAGLHAIKCGIEMPGPDPESDIIRRGHALEPIVAGEVAKLRPDWIITRAREYLRDKPARLGATPDYYYTGPAGRRGILQCKTVGASKFREEWEDGPPLWIILQLAQEMMLDDAEEGAIGVLVISEWTFQCFVFEIARNANAERRLRKAAAKFWKSLDAGEVPTLDYARDGDLIDLMYPTAKPGNVLDLTANNRIRELLDQRELQKTLKKEAESAEQEIENEIKALIGDYESAIVPDWRVSWKSQHRNAYSVEATDFRVLRATREKAKKK